MSSSQKKPLFGKIVITVALFIASAFTSALAEDDAKFAVSPDPNGHLWKVSASRCGAVAVPPLAGEQYRFDSGFATHIWIASDTDQERCKQAEVFQRTVNDFTVGTQYVENSQLIPKATRKVCWNKVNGVVMSPPISDSAMPTPRVVRKLQLQAGDSQATLAVDGSSVCPSDILTSDLDKLL